MSNSEKTKWVIDPTHSEISFKVKHLMITNVKGVFNDFGGSILTIGDGFDTSEIEFSLNPASVDTGVADRDGHLKSPDFFDVKKFPISTFKGGSVQKKDNQGNFVLLGDLTIKEITKPVKLDVEFNGTMKDPWGNHKAGYTVTGKINRKEWGLNWNAMLEAGGVLVSDDVTINCDVQLVKQA
jgi:polyisoprenoid-binding protein YceI